MIPVLPLTPERFAPYGSVAQPPGSPPTAQGDAFRYWSDVARYAVEGETEVGYCIVTRQPTPAVDWVERHDRTPEVLVPIDRAVVLPVLGEGALEAFRVEPGEVVVIDAGVWHSACHPADGDAATYLVLFRRGTPAQDVTMRDLDPTPLSL
ncbi:ureidoglycolate lyase [Rubrivirga sp.]|uniref:ureidoglycolate lyase n=1 Tax=Rubrivirga sp. TaxID=1885344 RepID=UPI003B52B640